jgi:hypothetical protein
MNSNVNKEYSDVQPRKNRLLKSRRIEIMNALAKYFPFPASFKAADVLMRFPELEYNENAFGFLSSAVNRKELNKVGYGDFQFVRPEIIATPQAGKTEGPSASEQRRTVAKRESIRKNRARKRAEGRTLISTDLPLYLVNEIDALNARRGTRSRTPIIEEAVRAFFGYKDQ